MKQWDAFISHASEDKDVVVPLAEALRSAGLKIWLDQQVLRLGDSLREKIDEGLADSRFGIVVLSPSFLAKRWPKRELNGMMAVEESGIRSSFPFGTISKGRRSCPTRRSWPIGWRATRALESRGSPLISSRSLSIHAAAVRPSKRQRSRAGSSTFWMARPKPVRSAISFRPIRRLRNVPLEDR